MAKELFFNRIFGAGNSARFRTIIPLSLSLSMSLSMFGFTDSLKNPSSTPSIKERKNG